MADGSPKKTSRNVGVRQRGVALSGKVYIIQALVKVKNPITLLQWFACYNPLGTDGRTGGRLAGWTDGRKIGQADASTYGRVVITFVGLAVEDGCEGATFRPPPAADSNNHWSSGILRGGLEGS